MALFLGTTVLAQVDRAELEGTVKDQSGALIADGKVQVIAVETGLSYGRAANANGCGRVMMTSTAVLSPA